MGSRNRFVYVLLVLTLVVIVAGPIACRRRPKPTIDAARTHAASFMAERLRGDTTAATGRMSTAGLGAFERQNGPVLDLRQVGDVTALLSVAETTESPGKYTFTYRIQQVGRETAYAAYWDEVVHVGTTGETYHVDDVTLPAGGREAYVADDTTVHVRADNNDSRLFGMDDLPDEFRPLGAGEDIAFGVGKEGIALLAFSPLGDRLAFVTWGTHGFLAMVPVAGGSPEGIDLHFEGLAVDVRWSPDSAQLATVIEAPTGNKALIAYRLSPRERVALGIEGMFPPEQFEVHSPDWTGPSQFTFEVQRAEGQADAKNGTWIADVATRTIKRPGAQ